MTCELGDSCNREQREKQIVLRLISSAEPQLLLLSAAYNGDVVRF